jgi:hypothetical protein
MGQLSSTMSPSSTMILLSLREMRQAPWVCHLCCTVTENRCKHRVVTDDLEPVCQSTAALLFQ